MKYTISKSTGSYHTDGTPEYGYGYVVTAQNASTLLTAVEKTSGKSPVRIIRDDGTRVVIALAYNARTGKFSAVIYTYIDAIHYIESGDLDYATCIGI